MKYTVLISKLSNFVDVKYFLKFFILLISFYYFNIFYIAITDFRGLLYSPFLEHYLNYVNWTRNSILYTSNFLAHAFGINSYVSMPYQLKIMHGGAVEMVYSCLGLGLMSFWIAYVIAHNYKSSSKLLWCAAGVFAIWVINVFRITSLIVVVKNHWKINNYIDHHTIFNIAAYILIFSMVMLFNKQSKKQDIKYCQKSYNNKLLYED